MGFFSWLFGEPEIVEPEKQYPKKIETEQGTAVHHFDEKYYVKLVHEYPIYSITAPFGIIYNEISGGGSSNNRGFRTPSYSFSISSNLEEKYIVKYMVDNCLKTKSWKAKDKDLIIDGKFMLEVRARQYYVYQPGGTLKKSRGYYEDSYHIHLPELPTPDKEMTTGYGC